MNKIIDKLIRKNMHSYGIRKRERTLTFSKMTHTYMNEKMLCRITIIFKHNLMNKLSIWHNYSSCEKQATEKIILILIFNVYVSTKFIWYSKRLGLFKNIILYVVEKV